MHNLGYKINHKTVYKLMDALGLKCKMRQVRYRSSKGEVGKIAPNILQRNFKSTLPNQKWVTDITQIKIKDEKLYLSPVLDLFNGEIIAYSISKSPNMQIIKDMLSKAMSKVKQNQGLILHSDQGWHYQHAGYCKVLQKSGIIQSMSRKGNCLDNAVMENFFGIMKTELLYAQTFETPEIFIKELKQYINYYNNERIKAKLNWKSPVQYRALIKQT